MNMELGGKETKLSKCFPYALRTKTYPSYWKFQIQCQYGTRNLNSLTILKQKYCKSSTTSNFDQICHLIWVLYAESIPCTKSLEVEISPYFTEVGTITYQFGEDQVYLNKYNQNPIRGQGYTHYKD